MVPTAPRQPLSTLSSINSIAASARTRAPAKTWSFIPMNATPRRRKPKAGETRLKAIASINIQAKATVMKRGKENNIPPSHIGPSQPVRTAPALRGLSLIPRLSGVAPVAPRPKWNSRLGLAKLNTAQTRSLNHEEAPLDTQEAVDVGLPSNNSPTISDLIFSSSAKGDSLPALTDSSLSLLAFDPVSTPNSSSKLWHTPNKVAHGTSSRAIVASPTKPEGDDAVDYDQTFATAREDVVDSDVDDDKFHDPLEHDDFHAVEPGILADTDATFAPNTEARAYLALPAGDRLKVVQHGDVPHATHIAPVPKKHKLPKVTVANLGGDGEEDDAYEADYSILSDPLGDETFAVLDDDENLSPLEYGTSPGDDGLDGVPKNVVLEAAEREEVETTKVEEGIEATEVGEEVEVAAFKEDSETTKLESRIEAVELTEPHEVIAQHDGLPTTERDTILDGIERDQHRVLEDTTANYLEENTTSHAALCTPDADDLSLTNDAVSTHLSDSNKTPEAPTWACPSPTISTLHSSMVLFNVMLIAFAFTAFPKTLVLAVFGLLYAVGIWGDLAWRNSRSEGEASPAEGHREVAGTEEVVRAEEDAGAGSLDPQD